MIISPTANIFGVKIAELRDVYKAVTKFETSVIHDVRVEMMNTKTYTMIRIEDGSQIQEWKDKSKGVELNYAQTTDVEFNINKLVAGGQIIANTDLAASTSQNLLDNLIKQATFAYMLNVESDILSMAMAKGEKLLTKEGTGDNEGFFGGATRALARESGWEIESEEVIWTTKTFWINFLTNDKRFISNTNSVGQQVIMNDYVGTFLGKRVRVVPKKVWNESIRKFNVANPTNKIVFDDIWFVIIRSKDAIIHLHWTGSAGAQVQPIMDDKAGNRQKISIEGMTLTIVDRCKEMVGYADKPNYIKGNITPLIQIVSKKLADDLFEFEEEAKK